MDDFIRINHDKITILVNDGKKDNDTDPQNTQRSKLRLRDKQLKEMGREWTRTISKY